MTPSAARILRRVDGRRHPKAQVAEQAAEIIESTLGTESGAGRAIAERVRTQLMPPVEPEERW